MVMGELEQTTQVLVIGSGPAGSAGALRAAELGLEVTWVDASPLPGGSYLHSGCIPAKCLLHLAQVLGDASSLRDKGVAFAPPAIDLAQMRRWRSGIIQSLAEELAREGRRRDIQFIRAAACFEDSNRVLLEGGDIRRIRFAHAVIAAGARPLSLEGVALGSGGRIMDPAAALELTEIPGTLLVLGSGAIALELGSIYAALGSRVSLITLGRPLLPDVDPDLTAPLRGRLDRLFASVDLNSTVVGIEEHASAIKVLLEGGPTRELHFERAVLAVGARPATAGLGLENTRVETDAGGFIRVDRQQRTSDPSIFAAGDVTGGLLLAHKAARAGKVAAEVIAGQPSAFDVQAVASVVHTDPQLAWCGLTEAGARRAERPHRVLRFPWQRSERAAIVGAADGLTKIVVDPQSGRVLGAGIAGRQAEAMISEALLAVEMGALAEDLALTLHPHPSLAETAAQAAEFFESPSSGTPPAES